MSSDSSVTLNVSCHCGLATFSYTMPDRETVMPLKSSICHCNSCRLATGMLWGSFAVIPAERPDFSKLTAYQSSGALTRYFCPVWGASVGNIEPDEWEFAAGLLDRIGGDLLSRVQMFVASTGDGGASVWLPDNLYNRPLKRLRGHRDSKAVTDEELASMAGIPGSVDPDKLQASCHCGAVQFYITRPDPEAKDKKHVGDRFNAAICPCESCRLTSGFEWAPWIFVPPENIKAADSQPFDANHESLTHYKSSKEVVRSFCKKCGAKVFYRWQGTWTWDIALGLFTSQKATRLESWFNWTPDEFDFLEEAGDKEFCDALVTGIKTRYADAQSRSHSQEVPLSQ